MSDTLMKLLSEDHASHALKVLRALPLLAKLYVVGTILTS